MFEEKTFSLTPIHFFAIAADCHYLNRIDQAPSFSTHLLPSTHSLCHEQAFAKVAIGWHEEGLAFQIQVNAPCVRSTFPNLSQGDSVELMIDTRDLKSAGFNTRFCHHFYFLAKPMEEQQQKGEITHFRTEDSHPLCDPHLLYCNIQATRHSYKMQIFVPSQCLYGYDPKQFDRLGFTYRINRAEGDPQHFSVVSRDYQIDQQPSLWGAITLVK